MLHVPIRCVLLHPLAIRHWQWRKCPWMNLSKWYIHTACDGLVWARRLKWNKMHRQNLTHVYEYGQKGKPKETGEHPVFKSCVCLHVFQLCAACFPVLCLHVGCHTMPSARARVFYKLRCSLRTFWVLRGVEPKRKLAQLLVMVTAAFRVRK